MFLKMVKQILRKSDCLYFVARKFYHLCIGLKNTITDRYSRFVFFQRYPMHLSCFFHKKAAHITYFVCGNAGDTYLSWCVRKVLSCKKYYLQSVRETVSEKLIKKLNACDFTIVGGGGLFLPDTNKNTISGWQWAVSESDLDLLTKPLIVYSVGYNYFDGQENTELFINSINKLVKKASFFGLRNSGSVRAIKELVKDENLRDKVVFQPCLTTVVSKILRINHRPIKNSIAVNMAFDRADRRFGNNKDQICQEIAKAIKQLELCGHKIFYACHCDDDINFLTYLNSEEVNYKVVELCKCLPKDILSFYNKMELVMGMRGHAQMIPFGIGCRILTLGSHQKMKWFLEDINSLDLYIDIKNDSSNLDSRIIKKIKYIEDNSDIIDKRLAEEKDKLWKITLENRKFIKRNI